MLNCFAENQKTLKRGKPSIKGKQLTQLFVLSLNSKNSRLRGHSLELLSLIKTQVKPAALLHIAGEVFNKKLKKQLQEEFGQLRVEPSREVARNMVVESDFRTGSKKTRKSVNWASAIRRVRTGTARQKLKQLQKVEQQFSSGSLPAGNLLQFLQNCLQQKGVQLKIAGMQFLSKVVESGEWSQKLMESSFGMAAQFVASSNKQLKICALRLLETIKQKDDESASPGLASAILCSMRSLRTQNKRRLKVLMDFVISNYPQKYLAE